MPEHHSIIIIGAGLSGLFCAWKLREKNKDVILLEARDRIGGRILASDYSGSSFDMGPSWIWPKLQPKLQQLICQLNLKTFKQFTSGDILYEQSDLKIERYNSKSTHAQSYRLEGTSQCLIDALHSQLEDSSVHLNTKVESIQKKAMTIEVTRNAKTYQYSADKIIFALPPRLIQENISFNPNLPDDTLTAWKNIATWMSVQTKINFIYSKPFWRDQNLSGEAFSHYGPLSEIYDASPADEKHYALTSFVARNTLRHNKINQQQLIDDSISQLQRLFGKQSKNTVAIQIKDWGQDNLTASKADLASVMQHPLYANDKPRSFWNNRLLLAGTEVARHSAGYLEGALESAIEAISNC